jgi:hypothetical protein
MLRITQPRTHAPTHPPTHLHQRQKAAPKVQQHVVHVPALSGLAAIVEEHLQGVAAGQDRRHTCMMRLVG